MKLLLKSAAVLTALAMPSFVPSIAYAEAVPASGKLDKDVRSTVYKDGQVYRIETTLNHATIIEFARGETITSVVAGDSVSFNVSSIPGGRALAIKPTRLGARTNLAVFTNKRTYYFNIHSSSKRRYTAVRFVYPNAPKTSNQGIPALAKAYKNKDYGLSKRNNFSPNLVYDDGTFTYFRFPKNGEVPAIFKYLDGREQTVNSVVRPDGTMRVSGVSKRWVLRIGKDEVCIVDLSKGGV